MKVVLIQHMDEVPAYYQEIKAFTAAAQVKYSSHVIDALIEWFTSFSSDANLAFASKRGINFLGRRSALRSPFFLLVYNGDELVAFVPLFRFMVDFGDGLNNCEVVSFCPDSTIFFYNDILIREGLGPSVLQAVFAFLRQYNAEMPHIVLLNHIPSSSDILPLLLKHSMDLLPHGFNVSASPVFWRGGPYPWNLNKLRAILENARNDQSLSEATLEKIDRAISTMGAPNKTMLMFKQNHPSLKSSIYGIFNGSRLPKALIGLYTEIESIFQSHLIKYPYLRLPESPEALVNTLSSSKRYYYKRYRERFLTRNGRFVKLHGKAITDQDIHDFIVLHRERWGNNSNILNNSTSLFLFSFLRKLALNDFLTLFFAVYQSKRIASLCCIDFKTRREFLSSGRSLDDEKLRAGKLLLYESIVDSINDGFHVFDFGYGDESYKSDYDWSYVTTNVIALSYGLHPRQFPNIFPLYEEVML